MMEVTRSSWHFKVYRAWRLYWHGCEPRGTVNLCPYMRVILLWAPLTILILPFRVPYMRAVTLGGLIGAPLHILHGEALFSVLVIYTIFVLVASFMFLLPLLFRGGGVVVDIGTKTTFWQLLRARGVAVHDRVCPELRIL
jgi:hypothetical protein